MNTTTTIKAGDVVRYARPEEGERDFRFTVMEVNGDRCLIQMGQGGYRIRPVECLLVAEVERVTEDES